MTERRDRKFCRVYYPDLQAEFPEVWQTDALLATWLRLLAIAEGAWPAVPELPRSARNAPVRRLVELGLVDVNGHKYRIRGLDAERTRRADAARNAAALRWHKNGTAPSNATGNAREMLRLDETRREESRVYRSRTSGRRHTAAADPERDAE